jgi:hypothetical protein
MTILELSGFFVPIKRVCSRSFTAYRGNIVGRHRLFDSPRRPEAADRISNRIHSILWGIGSHKLACADDNGRRRLGLEADVKELTLISAVACLCLALAWVHEANFFAMAFATVAAIAGVEAVRRSL